MSTERRFPRGRLSQDDDGELEIAIGVANNAVVINFGRPVRWIGLGAFEAKTLAGLLLKHAADLEV